MRVTLASMPLILGGVLLGFRLLSPAAEQGTSRFTVPAGFDVEEVLSHDEIGSVVALTFDSQGRMVVAKEFGEVVTLLPRGDGTYEQRVFTEEVTNSQGLVFDGPDLLLTAVGPEGVGLYRAVDETGDARADRVELVAAANRRIEDHGPHNVIWGPDGQLYWVHGDLSGIVDRPSTLSPVRSYEEASLLGRAPASNLFAAYRAPAAKIYRSDVARHAGAATRPGDPNRRPGWEMVAMGLRNPYDLAFNLAGELFTFDADMEPDLAMPWYRDNRLYHILPGGDYGYREGGAVHADHYFDSAPPLEMLGRGSPAGVVTYNAYAYPREFWDMVLFADWSRGRIIMTRLTRDGAGYTPESSNFVFGTPLNVTGIDVGPDGNVYFALGGRWTQGGVYRVVYRGTDAMGAPAARTPLERVLTAAQPRSAQSRELARATRGELGNAWQRQLTAVVRDPQQEPERRVRALELLEVFGPAPDEALLRTLAADAAWEVRSAAAYYLGLRTTESARRQLAAMLRDPDSMVQRRAAEAMLRTGIHPAMEVPFDPIADVFPLLASPDRSLRYAARTLLREVDVNLWREEALRLTSHTQAVEALMAYLQTIRSPDMYDLGRFVNRGLEMLRTNPSDAEALDIVRVLQVAMTKDHGVHAFPVFPSTAPVVGGVIYLPGRGFFNSDQEDGPTLSSTRAYNDIGELLLARFPSADWRLNREIARVLAYLQTPAAVPAIAAELRNSANTSHQQIHYVDMLSHFQSGWDDASIETVTAWFEQAARDRLTGGFINAMRGDFLRQIPDATAELAMARIQAAQPAAATVPGGAGLPMTEEQIENLIFNPQGLLADPAGGVRAYERAACIVCHTFGPIGTQFGPDLTTVGQRFSRADLVRKLVNPSESVASQFEGVTVTRTDGSTVSGLLTQDNAQGVVLQMAGGAEVAIPAANIAGRARAQESLMPAGLLDALTNNERNALLNLLQAGPAAIPDTALARLNAR